MIIVWKTCVSCVVIVIRNYLHTRAEIEGRISRVGLAAAVLKAEGPNNGCGGSSPSPTAKCTLDILFVSFNPSVSIC